MKLGIMQPYFFPYVGYFSLICATDKWVVFDKVQYIKKGWINRNRILKSGFNDWQYVIVPIKKASSKASIYDTKIDLSKDWKNLILAQLEHYKKRAPYFKQTIEFVNWCFDSDTSHISRLNVEILEKTCEHIGLKFDYQFYSDLNLNIQNVKFPGQWALKISELLEADEYINPLGGEGIFDSKAFQEKGIQLNFITNNMSPYDQKNTAFFEGLSILDLMMFNSNAEINNLISQYKLVNATYNMKYE